MTATVDLPLTARHDLARITDTTGFEVTGMLVAGDAGTVTVTFTHDRFTEFADRVEDYRDENRWCPICGPAGITGDDL